MLQEASSAGLRFEVAPSNCRRRPSEPFEPPEKFHEKATVEIKRWNDCVASNGEAICLKRYDPQQLIKGMYACFVEVNSEYRVIGVGE